MTQPNEEQTSTVTQEYQKSEEYQNFESLLKQVASVPKTEVDRRIQAGKDARAQKRQDAKGTK